MGPLGLDPGELWKEAKTVVALPPPGFPRPQVHLHTIPGVEGLAKVNPECFAFNGSPLWVLPRKGVSASRTQPP